MRHAQKIRAVAVTAAATVAFAAPFAAPFAARAGAEEAPVTPGTALEEPASPTVAPAPVEQGTTLAPPPAPTPTPAKPPANGGVSAGSGDGKDDAADGDEEEAAPAPEGSEGALPVPSPTTVLPVPSLPSSSCAATGVPPLLIPIYQRAAAKYELGPQGPAILAGINLIETAFGTNLNVSSAGALGWMQFMPETWAGYGVDANGDGVADPFNPEDAIFAAANYLSASGLPGDTYGAIFAYNHADWYVADVLANATCYADEVGAPGFGASVSPQLQVLKCEPAPAWRERIPPEYLRAFEDAAARYELGKRGVWAMAAIAHLESDFGRGMSKRQLRETGPVGLDGTEWREYAVDGDQDGKIHRADPDDSAATLARLIWSRGSLSAGIFSHNQAEWYVQEVLQEADAIAGKCKVRYIEWALALPNAVIAPIKWENLTLSNELEKRDLETGALDPRIVGLLGAITQAHQITISSLRSDHSMYTVEGGVSNHYYGRAMDIAAVDGVSCTDVSPTAPCAELAQTLAYLPAPAMPTELIYCFDVDGPGPAFARADHCDHVHAGYDG